MRGDLKPRTYMAHRGTSAAQQRGSHLKREQPLEAACALATLKAQVIARGAI